MDRQQQLVSDVIGLIDGMSPEDRKAVLLHFIRDEALLDIALSPEGLPLDLTAFFIRYMGERGRIDGQR